jgi:hypothetical protein
MPEPGRGNGLSRKGFVDWLIGTSVGGFLLAVLYPVTRYLIPAPPGHCKRALCRHASVSGFAHEDRQHRP